MADEFECSECGRSFESRRGLGVHRSHTHEGAEDAGGSGEGSGSNTLDADGFPISVRQKLVAVLALGLVTGFASGVIYASPPADPGVVKLDTTSFPYGDVAYGTGSGSVTFGNVTHNLDGEPYIGSGDAELVLVSYEDFECPFCDRFNDNAFPAIRRNYIETGKAKYYFKQFPLSPRAHPWAMEGAVASECVLEQDAGAFWVFHHGFFSNQDALNRAYKKDPGLIDKSMKTWAEQTGLDTEQFNQCYDSQETRSEVQQDRAEGSEAGVRGTPTVFVGSQKIVGAQRYPTFETAIDSYLER